MIKKKIPLRTRTSWLSQKKLVKELPQRGKSNLKRDRVRVALPPGKRVSASGNIYWETRKNRSDAIGSNV